MREGTRQSVVLSSITRGNHSKEEILQHSCGMVSSDVNGALKALVDKGLVFMRENEYFPYINNVHNKLNSQLWNGAILI